MPRYPTEVDTSKMGHLSGKRQVVTAPMSLKLNVSLVSLEHIYTKAWKFLTPSIPWNKMTYNNFVAEDDQIQQGL